MSAEAVFKEATYRGHFATESLVCIAELEVLGSIALGRGREASES